MPSEKTRLDQLLLERGFAQNLKESQAFIMSGYIMVNETKLTKPGQIVATDSDLRFTKNFSRFAGRGALKLEGALKHFAVSVENRICVDVGASTGGFTDVLLKEGASKVYAFDVGYGQMISRLASDPKVIVKDKFNIKNITHADIDNEMNPFVVIDVSFISLKSVLPSLKQLAASCSSVEIIALLKPQFEARNSELEKGIVTAASAKFRIIKSVLKNIKYELKGKIMGITSSPIRGNAGNEEFFIWCRF